MLWFFCFAFTLMYLKLHCIHTKITNQVFKCHSTSLFSMKMFFITGNRSMCTYIMNLSRFLFGRILYNATNRNSSRKYSFLRSVVLNSHSQERVLTTCEWTTLKRYCERNQNIRIKLRFIYFPLKFNIDEISNLNSAWSEYLH